MKKSKQVRIKAPFWLALIPTFLAIVWVERALQLLQDPTTFLVAVAFTTLYVGAVALAGSLENQLWGGYSLFAVTVAYLTIGVEETLWMILAGTGIAIAIQARWGNFTTYKRQALLNEYLGRVTITGNALLASFTLYYVFGGEIPFLSLNDMSNHIALAIANTSGFLVANALGVLLMKAPLATYWQVLRQNTVMDFTLLLVAVILPSVTFNLGVGATMILVGLVMFQAVRYRQINETRELLEKRALEMSTLMSLGQAVSSNLSLNRILAQVHDEIGKLVESTTIFTALYDNYGQTISYPMVTAKGQNIEWQPRPLKKGLTDWVIRNRKSLMLNMLESVNFGMMGIDPSQVDSRAYLGVPLMVGDEIIGAIGVSHDSTPEAFDNVDLSVLETIASQASLAIRNANLYERTVDLVTNLATVNQSLQEVMFNLDRDSAMLMGCQVACQVTNTQKSAVFLVKDRLNAVPAKTRNITFPPDTLLPLHTEHYEGGGRVVPNVAESTDETLKALAKASGFQACLEMPLRSVNAMVGYVAVYATEPRYFEPATINLLEMLAKQITAAFDNADLLHALELYASEQSQLVYLARITNSDLNLGRVITGVCGVIKQMVEMDDVFVALLENKPDEALLYQPAETSKEPPSIHPLNLEEYLELQTVIENPSFASPYILYQNDESLSEAMLAWMAREQYSMMILMPLLVNQQAFGVMLLGSRRLTTFEESPRRLLDMVTYQVSAQIHNARTYALTETALAQQLEQLALIESIAQKISQSLELDLIIANVLDAAIQATQADSVELALLDETQRWQLITQTNQHVAHEQLVIQIQETVNADIHRVVETRQMAIRTEAPSHLVVPLLSGERAIGALRIHRHTANAFTAEHAGFVQSLAGHAAISIDNANLLEERQDQIHTLTLLRELTLQVVGTVDHDFVLYAILQVSLKLLGGLEAALYRYDPITDEVVILAGASRTFQGIIAIDPNLPTMPVLEVIQKNSVTMHQLNTLPADNQPHFASMVAIPIRRQDAITEILAVGYEEYHRFTKRDYNTIDLLAAQVASHLENITLHQVIQANSERMRVILDSTRDGIVFLDIAGRVQDANLAASALLNLSLESHLKEQFSRLIARNANRSLEGAWDEFATFSASEQLPSQREFVFGKQGAVTHVQAFLLPVRDGDGALMGRLLLMRDITEERELAITRESLQRMVFHDLRSPLGAIITSLGFMQILIGDIESETTKDLEKTVGISLESANTLMRLMDTLRDIPLMREGKLRLRRERMLLTWVARKACEILEGSLLEGGIQTHVNIEPEFFVEIDADLIQRVLMNLIHNASKFTPQGGKIMVTTRPTSHPDQICVLVSDNGPGIPEEMQDQIFEEFRQVDSIKPMRGGRGTGLGLTFCRLAVEAHHGRIWVEPNGSVLSGACIAFTLPIG